MTPSERDEAEDDAAFARAGFLVAVLALALLAVAGATWIARAAKAREAAALEAIPDLLTSWPAEGGLGVPDLSGFAVFPPVVLLALLVRNRWNSWNGWAQTWSPRARWILAGVAALVSAGLLITGLAGAGRDLGAATLSGVVWLHDGAPRGEARWGDATQVEITCWDDALTYDVAFPDGQVAPLGQGAGDDIGRWIDRLTIVDQSLRAYAVPRAREGEEACLRRYDEGLIPEEKARFRAVVAG